MRKNTSLWAGVAILAILGMSYFITITKYGGNYEIEDKLLGIIIFHNLYVLIAYIAIALFFIIKWFMMLDKFSRQSKNKRTKHKS